MNFSRASGILLHPTSLPGRFGIGDLGPAAYHFIDILEETGQSLWQVLPLGPTGYGDSPYQCFSAFAGNPLLVSPELLVADRLLDQSDLDHIPDFPEERVDYGSVIEFKYRLLTKAHENFITRRAGGKDPLIEPWESFCRQAEWWLDDYALFRSIKDLHDGHEWPRWEPYLRDREDNALHFFRENHADDIDRHKFYQFLFFKQWVALAAHANSRGVGIIGDIPIFVAHDSADVWAHRELYYLDEAGMPMIVAGVPPDYFSQDGQLWGNPLYRWDRMQQDGYRWWISRVHAALSLFDIVRLDHFRGFEKYWAVPAGERTARNGSWQEGPGPFLFQAIRDALGELPIIAEDLGLITKAVKELRQMFGLPGMRVLQFGFNPDPDADDLKPFGFDRETVVYTGTHDNDTTIGWFESGKANDGRFAETDERAVALRYLGTDGREINWDFIRLALASVANTAIIPLQDLFGLGTEARMNVPSREAGNWGWRYRASDITAEIRTRLGGMTEIYGRNRGRVKSIAVSKEPEAL